MPSFNQFYGVPPGYNAEQAFVGRFDYPQTTTEALPSFLSIDFTQDWQAYLAAVLEYVLEDNAEHEFVVQENSVRDWYHAVWMHPTSLGREFVHGLTKERRTGAEQLAEGLTTSFDTWAIGFYNSFGATTFADIWSDPCNPSVDDVRFPAGTVSFKLLFTTATSADLPYLEGAPEWMADIGRGTSGQRVRPVRLLQLDVAVRDSRAISTGWVFGTYVYQAGNAAGDPWRRLDPVGISWGNDPYVLPGGMLTENVINPAMLDVTHGWASRLVLGWAGRLNGPLDNQVSSCHSCHGTAQYPRSDDFANVPNSAAAVGQELIRLAEYFRNIPAGAVFDPLSTLRTAQTLVLARPLDYSLQLQTGLERMCIAADRGDPPFDVVAAPTICTELAAPAMAPTAVPGTDIGVIDVQRALIDRWILEAENPVR